MAKTIYPGIPFSPITVLTQPLNEESSIVYVEDSSVFPDGPNIATIGADENAETIFYAQKAEGLLSGCIRGLEGTAKAWQIDEVIARNFTDYDYQSLIEAITQNQQTKANKSETVFDVGNALNEYNTVLEMANSVSGSMVALAVLDSNLYSAEDRPAAQELFYIITSDKVKRKLVIAVSYTSYDVWIRRIFDKSWSTDWKKVGVATIDSILNQKADKNKALQTNLYAQYAKDLLNPNTAVNVSNIFTNPPLTNMATLDHRAVGYVYADKPVGAPPISGSDPEYWEVLTASTNYKRALQLATQCYSVGQKNGRMFLRTRHLDNEDFTKWQAWREVATCYCADMEWKSLPMINGWINATNDPAAALKYRKGADGKVVYVTGYIKQPNTLTADNKIIAYLPEGYRPKNYCWKPSVNETKEGVVSIRVNLDGKIYLTNYGTNVQAITNSALPVCITIPI